jgi:hypothetical protein
LMYFLDVGNGFQWGICKILWTISPNVWKTLGIKFNPWIWIQILLFVN